MMFDFGITHVEVYDTIRAEDGRRLWLVTLKEYKKITASWFIPFGPPGALVLA